MFFIHYVCRDHNDKSIVEQFNDSTNTFVCKREAERALKEKVSAFNVNCKQGIWEGKVVSAF